MDERESDPTAAFRGGAAGIEPGAADAASPGGGDDGQRGEGGAADDGGSTLTETPGVDENERRTIRSGMAATSEIGDRDAQDDAERQGDGTPRPL
jgi:hypothetical protein